MGVVKLHVCDRCDDICDTLIKIPPCGIKVNIFGHLDTVYGQDEEGNSMNGEFCYECFGELLINLESDYE